MQESIVDCFCKLEIGGGVITKKMFLAFFIIAGLSNRNENEEEEVESSGKEHSYDDEDDTEYSYTDEDKQQEETAEDMEDASEKYFFQTTTKVPEKIEQTESETSEEGEEIIEEQIKEVYYFNYYDTVEEEGL